MIVLQNWGVTQAHPTFRYIAPELRGFFLQGAVYGYPGRPDGEEILTSRIVSIKGRVVTCESRQYRLGRVRPEYRKWLKEQGIRYNSRNPIHFQSLQGG